MIPLILTAVIALGIGLAIGRKLGHMESQDIVDGLTTAVTTEIAQVAADKIEIADLKAQLANGNPDGSVLFTADQVASLQALVPALAADDDTTTTP